MKVRIKNFYHRNYVFILVVHSNEMHKNWLRFEFSGQSKLNSQKPFLVLIISKNKHFSAHTVCQSFKNWTFDYRTKLSKHNIQHRILIFFEIIKTQEDRTPKLYNLIPFLLLMFYIDKGWSRSKFHQPNWPWVNLK